jgi:hypothetical protein
MLMVGRRAAPYSAPAVDDHDLTDLLASWPHEPGRVNARKIIGRDGRPRLQVRVELGVLQMELEGRPDGQRPQGHPSLLEYQQQRLRRYRNQTGGDVGFVLSGTECRALREEAMLYYHRYVALFAVGDFDGVAADARRNLELFDLCRQYGQAPEDRSMLEQLRPAVIMMQARAEAEAALQAGNSRLALAALDRGIQEIRAVYQEAGDAAWEESNEVQLLRGMRDVLVPKLPSSQRAELQERLQAALDAENYELAAILRDELRMLRE